MSDSQVLLSTEQIEKRFGGLVALSRVTLSIRSGEIVGVIGPNGSGKTTLFNCISGFYRPEVGRILWKGEEITCLEAHQVAERGISRTFQLAKLFRNLPVLENVTIAKHLRRKAGFLEALFKTRAYEEEEARAVEEALGLLRLVGLQARKNALAGELPYGSQRLLAVAIALSSNPEMLLLDEPTAGMNHEEAEHLAAILRDINAKGVTLCVVEHNMKFVMKLAKRIVALNYGRVICEGEPSVVSEDETVITAYLGGRL